MFNKLLTVLSFLFFSFLFLSTAPAFAQSQGPGAQPMTNEGSASSMVVPQPALPTVKREPLTFFGQWTLGFYNGSRVTMSGEVSLQYSEKNITFNGGQGNSDGSMQFYGVVDNEYGSSVTVYYNPNVDKGYVQMFIYEPDYEYGTSNQYTSTECRVFLAPKGNDYLHGVMSAIQQSTDWNGNWVTRSLFSGQVDIYRTPAPSGPMMSTTPTVSGGGGKG